MKLDELSNGVTLYCLGNIFSVYFRWEMAQKGLQEYVYEILGRETKTLKYSYTQHIATNPNAKLRGSF